MGEEEKEEEEEATPSTIDIKFNYPQTSAFPSHYFVQQSQLLPFKRFQSIQRRRERRGGGEGERARISGRFIYTPALHSTIDPQRFHYFSPSNAESTNRFTCARFRKRLLPISFSQTHQSGGEGENVQLSSLFPFPIRFHASIVPSTDLFFSPPPPPPPPILSTTNDISHGRSVNGISFFLLSLSFSWKIVGRRKREREWRSLFVREDFF